MSDSGSADVTDELGGRDVLTDQPEAASADRRLPSPRTVVIGITGVVAVVSMLAGVIGFWTLRTATDSDRFEARVEELLVREDVSDALARRVVAEVAEAIELTAALDAVVPELLEPAVAVLLAGVRSRVELQLGELLRSERFVTLVGAAAGTAHANAVRVIEGDDVIDVDGVSFVDGQVTVNLLPVVAAALGLFQEIGLFRDAEIPEFQRGGDPAEQRAALSQALDRPLPPAFGEVVVFESAAIDRVGSTVGLVRDVFVLAKRALWLLLVLGLGLAALAIWLSEQRWRSASYLVAGLFASALVVRWVVGRARDRIPEAVDQPGARATVADLARGLERSINHTLLSVSVGALLLLVAVAFVTARYPRRVG